MRKKRLFYLTLALIAVCIFTGVISAQTNRGKQISVWIGWSELPRSTRRRSGFPGANRDES